jgi:2-C-methyl-D-erythritol 4-phosphate cytidylyltransferase
MAAHGRLTVAAILLAAGDGLRLGADVPKAFCEVGGLTLLEHALAPFIQHVAILDVIVVAPAALAQRAAELAAGQATVVIGGASRPASVRAGLSALAPDVDAVLVHDVARPFVPPAVLTRVIAALSAGAVAVVPAIAVTDTIKVVGLDATVLDTPDRSSLRAIQTPQGFRRDALDAAHAGLDDLVTDDAGLIERAGGAVVVVEGADEAFKLTRPWDLRIAATLLSGR